ncbi:MULTISPECIES: FKBP-type peptidyl-prolyl cis-trans isomerase [Streptomyces]|uniref:FKBP-type peptidyl-prolyl cis-trans isomerase n=1 Tax=Streptomyces TaxID=1883 RepID=UPI00163C8ABF|nr:MULTISPECIES: FKBP-type peptidyl-prolyl cis-trans isomerase [Streptomyces]MBC2878240.1 FKBP-type peptidyl-prolyl cis-trans isomerase [Streptomyces sp. TYQ1024]UBI39735.1 FKBP-type peptidyl-prolyl cis-trans isomerase [Streptomyces mobaraensis]UKW32316.1 FKBP-type peptidyl-prolyl cis-trans isomerase [Streptomyces sp. TYQ1024]
MLRFTAGRTPQSRRLARTASGTRPSRRLAAALAVPVLLLTAAGCGSDDDGSKKSSESSSKASASSGSAQGGSKITVTGAFGEQPKISAPKDAKGPDKVRITTITEGKGATVEKGAFARLAFAVQSTQEGTTAKGTWNPEPGQDTKGPRRELVQRVGGGEGGGQVPDAVADALVGRKVGTRVWAEGTLKSMYGDKVQQNADQTLVWVLDVVGTGKVDAKAEAKGEQAKPDAGMPEVKAESGKAAEITMPKGEKAPKELKEQVLIKGDGPEVKAGDGLVAQYTGVLWDGGKKFDSSWDHGGATAFQIGTGSVVSGWDKGLVGKHVGDRVLLVLPAEQAYGSSPPPGSGIPADAPLVFVVDIVGKV